MTDFIDRAAFIKSICNSCDGWCDKVDCDCVNCKSDHRCDIVCSISEAPAVEAEPVKHGRWVKDHDGDEYCENCYRYMPDREVTGDPCATNYCPNCGAKMDLEATDEQS